MRHRICDCHVLETLSQKFLFFVNLKGIWGHKVCLISSLLSLQASARDREISSSQSSFLHPSLYCSVMLFFPFLAAWPQRRGVGAASEEADVVSKGSSWRNWGKWAYREMRWELWRKGLSVIWMGIICQKRRWNRRRSLPHIPKKEEIMLESKKTWRRLKEGRKTDLCRKSVALWKPCWLFLVL